MAPQKNKPVSVEVKYNEGIELAIIAATRAGVKNAMKYYEREVRKEFKSAPSGVLRSGSFKGRIFGGGEGKTIKHSPPGQTPYRQSENLVNSIYSGINRATKDNYEGIIASDAPYAEELEKGGTLNTYLNKKHAKIKIVNPKPENLKLQATPRPTFTKVWKRNEKQIFRIIKARVPFLTRMKVIFRL